MCVVLLHLPTCNEDFYIVGAGKEVILCSIIKEKIINNVDCNNYTK